MVKSIAAPPPARVSRLERKVLRASTRELLVRCGTEIFTERGFQATGIDEIRRRVNVPKGSFYHFFESKHDFGLAVIDNYAVYFEKKLARCFDVPETRPLARLEAFACEAMRAMEKYGFKRGCLVGNLGQELGGLDDEFRERLEAVLQAWQRRTAVCFEDAVIAGELPVSTDCNGLAEYFWIGWEGAILRAKLTRSNDPLKKFLAHFLLTAHSR